MAECACCGQTLPPDLPDGLVLRGKRFTIYDAIRKAGKHGIDSRRLWSMLYDHDPNGGPESTNIISAHVGQINHRLRPFGQKLISGQAGHGVFGIYRLVLNA